MTTVLDDAENRLGPAVVTAQTVRQERIESMREEIGRANRELAPVKLAELEAFINTDIRPFLARVSSIGQRAQKPLPQHIQDYGKEMFMLCDIVPNAVRTGISAWDTLTPPIWTDGKSLDLNARAQTIHQIRSQLRNWDGTRGRLADLKAYIENYVRESDWPSMQPGPVQVET